MIIIVTPSYNESTGGRIVLHLLGKRLQSLGYQVSFCPLRCTDQEFCNPYNLPLRNIAAPTDIVIYPEIVGGNPLHAKNGVRYVLYPRKQQYGAQDFILYYSERYWQEEGSKQPKNILYITDGKLAYFQNQGKPREGDCFIMKKGVRQGGVQMLHRKDAYEFCNRPSNKELLEVFNRCARFISYDSCTFLNVQAALCGCDSVVAPRPGLTKEQVYATHPGLPIGAGIAYGLVEIADAREGQGILRKHFETLEQNQDGLIKQMFLRILAHFRIVDLRL